MPRTPAVLTALLLLLLLPTAAAAAPGDPDPSFGGGDGVVAEPVQPGAVNDDFEDIARTSDGRLVVAGEIPGANLVFARFNADGTRDQSFGDGGDGLTVVPDVSGIEGLALAPDGRIVAIGQRPNGSEIDLVVVRLLPNGDPDGSFGTDGVIVVATGSNVNERPFDVTVDGQGRIVVVGERETTTTANAFVVRLTAAGLDDGFAGDGLADVPVGTAGDDRPRIVAVDPAGRVVVGGYAEFDPARGLDYFAFRLRDDGEPDASFGSGGVGSLPIAAGDVDDRIQDMALTPSGGVALTGKIDVPGGVGVNDQIGIGVFTASGQPDTGFDGDGARMVELTPGDADDRARTLVAQPDGALVVAADVGESPRTPALLRFRPDGSLDPTWGQGGIARPTVPGFARFGSSVLQPDGRFVAVGQVSGGMATSGDILLTRVLGDEADLTFEPLARPAVITFGLRDLALTFLTLNRGPQTARGTRVTVTPPAGTTLLELRGAGCDLASRTCAIGDLASGARSAVTAIVRPPGAGTYTATARVSSLTPDPVPGNDTGSDRDSVVLEQPRPDRPDRIAPAITGAALSPTTFRVAPGVARIAQRRARGATLRLRLSEAARLTLTVDRRVAGRRVRGRCRTGRRAPRRGARCTRLARLRPAIRLSARAGLNRIRFTGRLSRRARLRPGRYRLTVLATDAAGNRSRPRRLAFRIVR